MVQPFSSPSLFVCTGRGRIYRPENDLHFVRIYAYVDRMSFCLLGSWTEKKRDSVCPHSRRRVFRPVERGWTRRVVGLESEISGWKRRGRNRRSADREAGLLPPAFKSTSVSDSPHYCLAAFSHSIRQQFNRGVSYGVCTALSQLPLRTPFILDRTLSDTWLRGKLPSFVYYDHCLRSTAWRVANHHSSDLACGSGCFCQRGLDLTPENRRGGCSPALFTYLFLRRISPTEDSIANLYVVPSARHGIWWVSFVGVSVDQRLPVVLF